MNKRLLTLILSFIAAVLIIGGFIFFVYERNKSLNSNSTAVNNSTGTTAGNSTSQNSAGNSNQNSGGPVLSQITTDAALFPSFSSDQLAIWYFSPDGHMYKQTISTGLKQEYILPANYKVDSVIWPNAGNDFIVVSSSNGARTFNYYNGQTKSFFTYPPNVKGVDFLPDGKHVVYEFDDAKGKAGLSMGNYDLSGHKPIVDLPDSGMTVKVSPVGNKVLLYKTGALADGKIYYVALDTNKIYPIRTASDNEVLWSPNGQKFVFNKLDTNNDKTSHMLWLGDIISGNDKNLNINTGFSKLAFDSTGNYLYAAVPGANGSDTFWKIDTKTLDKTQVYTPPQGTVINSSNLLVRSDGKFIFFIGKSGTLYSLAL